VNSSSDSRKTKIAAAISPGAANGKVYATETYRMVANSPCLSCHQVPSLMPNPGKYPALSLAPDRLRPDWAQRWIASRRSLAASQNGRLRSSGKGTGLFEVALTV